MEELQAGVRRGTRLACAAEGGRRYGRRCAGAGAALNQAWAFAGRWVSVQKVAGCARVAACGGNGPPVCVARQYRQRVWAARVVRGAAESDF